MSQRQPVRRAAVVPLADVRYLSPRISRKPAPELRIVGIDLGAATPVLREQPVLSFSHGRICG